jgi:hypothetical protein
VKWQKEAGEEEDQRLLGLKGQQVKMLLIKERRRLKCEGGWMEEEERIGGRLDGWMGLMGLFMVKKRKEG